MRFIRGAYLMTDQFAAFDQRVKRNLGEMQLKAVRIFGSYDAEMASRGILNSSMRVRGQLDRIKTNLERAIDLTLSEASNLPGNRHITRSQVAPKLQEYLTEHLNNMFGSVNWGQGLPSMNKVVADDREQLAEMVKAEMREFEAEVWHPREAPGFAPPVTNTVNVHGSNSGVIQQGGHGSTQGASQTEGAIDEFLAQLAITAVADDMKAEMRAEVETLRLQSKRASPNRPVMQAAAGGLYQLALGIGGNILTPHVLALLAVFGIKV
jgi:hypothetical protein